MAAKETGKQRATRIPLDYFVKRTSLDCWKSGLGWLALLLAIAWPASGFLRSDGGNVWYSRGPVAHVHQTWNNDCAACHESFKTIQGPDHWAATLIPAWFQTTRKEHQCSTCHAGPQHNKNEKTTPDCVQCHREHRGSDVPLIRMDDRDCTQCHGEVTVAAKAGTSLDIPKSLQQIRGFSREGGHGDFSRLPEIAATQKLKFNHKLHMAPDLVTPETGDPHFTPDRLSDFDQKRYVKDGHIQLDCVSCHQLDNNNRAAGDYMLPIRYEVHCQACHPLTYERKDPNDAKSGALAVPHGKQPREIRQHLQGVYTAKALKEEWKAFERPTRPLPGKTLGDEAAKVGNAINEKVAAAEKSLYLGKKTCGECHYDAPAVHLTKTDPPVMIKEELHAIATPNIPQVWFRHARFDHVSHRAVKCQACHENGTKADGQTKTTISESLKAEDIFIPRIDVCVQCHAPKTDSAGGARHDCTECHRYHNGGEHSMQGLGATARNPRERRAIDEFLMNTKKQEQR